MELTSTQVNGRISNCLITDSGANGVHVIETVNAVTDWDLLDSWVANSGQSVIIMDKAAGWKIRGNHLYGVQANGIFAPGVLGPSSTATVLVQRENEQAVRPKRRDTALRAGIFKARGSTDPMSFLRAA